MARAVHEDLPPAALVTDSVNVTGQVDIYRNGDLPKRPIIRIAQVGAHGNGYATEETLEQALVKEALKVNADCIILTNREVSKDETIGSYGGGIFMANSIQRPHLYGIACKYAKVSLGINANKDGLITYVTAGSAAAKAGIVEGDKLLAVNGVPISSSPFVIEREISVKKPGDVVKVEFLNKNGDKESRSVTLGAS